MASGDWILFDQARTDLGNKIHDMDGDTFKYAFLTAAVTPTAADAAPHFGGTGTTDHSATETSGGNVPAGGVTIDGGSLVWDGDKWDFADISVTSHASNPSAARWVVVYNSTDANKRCIAYHDLGSARDLTAGNYSDTIHTSGVFTVSSA